MLEIRPCCEQCRKPLAANSTDAMICSYECTFCIDCVDTILLNVCPNCGGGFVPRPVRPSKTYLEGVSLAHQAASTKEVYAPVNKEEHQSFAKKIKEIAADKR